LYHLTSDINTVGQQCILPWAVFDNEGFTLSVNPYNCWPNFEWFAVLFLQIKLMFM